MIFVRRFLMTNLLVANFCPVLALLTIGLTQTLSPAFGLQPANLTVILGSVGLSVLLIILAYLTYRPREKADPEHGWRP